MCGKDRARKRLLFITYKTFVPKFYLEPFGLVNYKDMLFVSLIYSLKFKKIYSAPLSLFP